MIKKSAAEESEGDYLSIALFIVDSEIIPISRYKTTSKSRHWHGISSGIYKVGICVGNGEEVRLCLEINKTKFL